MMCELCNPHRPPAGSASPNHNEDEGGGSFDDIVNAYESKGDE